MKRIYTFGNGQAEGRADMKNLLGGKGANLAEMNLIGVPVPPGFTITTEVCTEYNTLGREAVVKILEEDVKKSVAHIEKLTGNTFGDAVNPLLVSVRSGARVSMPGMMDTVLNLGINDTVVEALSKKSGNPRFAWDSYRRFVQMYGDVVLGMKPKSKQDIDPFEEILDKVKEEKGVKNDTELTVDDLKGLVVKFKAAVKKSTGKDFPESAWEQLWGAIYAVFDSWMNERAILYRRMNQIPEEWGTAVNVQAMVYGNMGNTSATGVAFTRDAATGEDIFNGEYLINAHRNKSQPKAHAAGLLSRASRKKNAQANTLHWKSRCLNVQKSLSRLSRNLKTTSKTCRTSSLQSRTTSCGCSRLVTESVQVPLWLKSRWTFSAQAKSTRRQCSAVWSHRNSMNCFTQCLTRTI